MSGQKSLENRSGFDHKSGHVVDQAAHLGIEIAVPNREGRPVTSHDFA
jgi:hypothetical protein